MATLSERFEESDGETIELEGRTVRQIYRRTIRPGEKLAIALRASAADPIQTLSLDVDGGALEIAGERLSKVLLRTDTAPPTTSAVVRSDADEAELTVWNGWIGSHDENHAWIGNSGMLVDDEGERVTLRCSDGHDGPTFDDLVVEMQIGG